ncbi:MAG TPA: alpha-1,6-glucosidase domain-containing protein [Permianibacter sp.]|nr:alpha-1,6-glucosidase domain-containing protein [Permianibacter sp.]
MAARLFSIPPIPMKPALLERFTLITLSILLASTAHAELPAPRLSDCDRPQQILAPTPTPAPAMTAIALNSELIYWSDGNGETLQLYASRDSSLQIDDKQRLRGFDDRVSLLPYQQPVSAALKARFPHLLQTQATGKLFQLVGVDRDRRLQLLQSQLLLARHDSSGRVLASASLQLAGWLDEEFASAELATLGAQPSRQQTQFALWAPTAQQVALCLYHNADNQADAVLPLQLDSRTGIWQLQRSGDLSGRYYNYLVDVVVPAAGLVRNRVTDPYSLSLSTDSVRSYIADLDSPTMKPAGWDSAPRPSAPQHATDLMIYELHVRDFSLHDSRVTPAYRGKYLAFTEPRSFGMQHLQALQQAGMTDIHLLPIFDFATVPEARCLTPSIPTAAANSPSQQAAISQLQGRDCYNWGYDPFHFNTPEGSYATDSKNGATRVRELRHMVMALHKTGLRVGMDVVYNHTHAAGQAPTSVLDRIVPGYYHRLNRQGEVETSTCCANTATEHRMMAKLMIDSAVIWARDYRIDSFRFDLMGHQPRAAMERLQTAVNAATGRHIPLIGEGWNFGEVANGARFVQASQLSLNGSGIGTFSDRARDAVRGGSAGDNGVAQLVNQGYVNGLFYAPNPHAIGKHSQRDLLTAADWVRVGLAGSLRDYRLQTADDSQRTLAAIDYAGQPAGYVSEPGEVVNYVENHDNQTLFDANVLKLPPDTTPDDRARVQILAAATVAFSQGIAYFHAGQDLLRSKSLDRNSFDSGDWFNKLDWSYQDNAFGTGLPPERDNGASWPWQQTLLADSHLKPRPREISWTRDAFRDLLRIRASSTLFRLRSAADIQQRLQFLNTGRNQIGTVIVGKLTGSNQNGPAYPGANFRAVLYAINVDTREHTLRLPSEQGQNWQLHPVHLADGAADQRPKTASRFVAATGELTVPARTALVYVQP